MTMRLARRTNLQRITSAVLVIGFTSTSLAWARGNSTWFKWVLAILWVVCMAQVIYVNIDFGRDRAR
jgi:hypothetical protein